jgi:hypothetical protein
MAIMFAMVSSSAEPATSVLAADSGVGAPPAEAGAAAGASGGVGVAAGGGAGVAGVAAGAGAGAGAGGGLGAALGFCCMTTMKDASVTPASASVASSVSTFPLCTRTIVSTAWLCVSATFALTSAILSPGSSSTSNLAFVLGG